MSTDEGWVAVVVRHLKFGPAKTVDLYLTSHSTKGVVLIAAMPHGLTKKQAEGLAVLYAAIRPNQIGNIEVRPWNE